MKKLSEYLRADKLCKGDVGIEIEIEGDDLPNVDDKYWKTERDGSLRDGKEYVLKAPVSLEEANSALRVLKEELIYSKPSFSFRTSVHVHLNVQDLTHKEICSLIYLYYLLEEPLMTYCGRSRKGNRFCLRLQDADGVINNLRLLFSVGVEYAIDNIDQDEVRYSALNIAALPKYGSLEFRAMEGNIDVNRLNIWLLAITKLKKAATNGLTPVDWYNRMNLLGSKKILDEVLDEISDVFVYPRLERDMALSASLSIDLPFMYVPEKEAVKAVRKRVVKPVEPVEEEEEEDGDE